jgi:hypothetical protein
VILLWRQQRSRCDCVDSGAWKEGDLATIAELLDLLQISSKERLNQANWRVLMGCRCEGEVTLKQKKRKRIPAAADAKTQLCTFRRQHFSHLPCTY